MLRIITGFVCVLKEGGLDKLSKIDKLSISDKKETYNLRYVSATEAKQRLAALLDAAQREPITIRRQKRDVAVLLSAQEYQRLCALNTAGFQRFCDRVAERAAARGLTEDRLTEILGDEG